jgi:hypothetical protein
MVMDENKIKICKLLKHVPSYKWKDKGAFVTVINGLEFCLSIERKKEGYFVETGLDSREYFNSIDDYVTLQVRDKKTGKIIESYTDIKSYNKESILVELWLNLCERVGDYEEEKRKKQELKEIKDGKERLERILEAVKW